jgi:hypothetical protein
VQETSQKTPGQFHSFAQVVKSLKKCIIDFMSNKFGHSFPSSFQHGYRKDSNTPTAALTVQSIIAKLLDKNKKMLVVSTDMSAAFDMLDKEILIPRMLQLGILQNVCSIYK